MASASPIVYQTVPVDVSWIVSPATSIGLSQSIGWPMASPTEVWRLARLGLNLTRQSATATRGELASNGTSSARSATTTGKTSLIRRTSGAISVEHENGSCDLTGLYCAEGIVDVRQRTALTHTFRRGSN